MALVPVSLKPDPDPKIRGWKPSGWYLFDTCRLQAIEVERGSFSSKAAVWKEIASRLGVSVSKAKSALGISCRKR